MKIIPSNQLLPITSDQAEDGLLVGMTVFDTTTGTPVQVTGKSGQVNGVFPMTGVEATNSYLAFFTSLPQKTYIFIFSVFTDDTYVTTTGVSKSFSASSKLIGPIFIQNLLVQIGCKDQPAQKPVVISKNSDGNVLLTFIDENKNSVDITSATEITISILESDCETLLVKTLESGISLVDGAINQALCQFTSEDLALLNSGDNDFQVSVVIGGITYAINVYYAISIEPGI